MAKKLKSLNPIIGTGYKTLSTIKDGEDGNIENFPDTLPKIPRLSYKRLGVSGLEIGWEFEDKIYYTYELYGSTTKGFEASEENLMFQGLASSYFYEAKPGEKWYFKARAKNTHGRYTEFSSELVAYTIKLDNLGEYVEGGSINGALIENATINNAHIKDLHADKITAGVLDADRIGANSITANKIEANAITSEKIQANAITTDKLAANIIASNHIQSGTITSGHIQSGTIESNHIKSNSINSNHIQANTIQSEHIQTGAITAGSGIIADGAIGSAQISSLDANKINAGEIDTSKVKIKGENGFLFIENNTLYVVDNNKKIRCELGVIENNSNYGFVVRGADGQTIMLDHNGVHNAGITDGAIDNRKVSENANISGKKLDIDSVIRTINEDGSVSIQGTKVQVGNTTLDVELSKQTNLINNHTTQLNNQQASINANTNAIKLKVDSQTYTADKNNMTTQMNKNTSAISVLEKEIELKVEQTDITTAINGVQVGGTNLLRNTHNPTDTSHWSGVEVINVSNIVKPPFDATTVFAKTNNTTTENYARTGRYVLEPNTTYTLSYYVYIDESISSIETYLLCSNLNENNDKYTQVLQPIKSTVIKNKWIKVQGTVTTGNDIVSGYVRIDNNGKVTKKANTILFTKVKLEKGNKATDWTPSPEDVVGQIDTKVSSAKAEIKATTDGITQSVSNLQTTTNRIQSNINNLQVGGRNLIAGTNTTTEYTSVKGNDTYTDAWAGKTTTKMLGTEYVLSFDAKADSATETVCYLYAPNTVTKSVSSTGFTDTSADGHCKVSLTTGWKRYWVKWTQISTDEIKSVVVGRNFSDIKVYVKGIKLEDGHTPTAWSPAPEDIQSQIDATAGEVTKTTAKVASIETNLNSITQRVQSTETTTSTLTTKVNQVDGKINTAKNEAILSAVGVKDTRNDNQNPQWYFTNYAKRTVEEFKFATVVGIPNAGSGVCGVVTTVVPWSDKSGGYPTQTFRSNTTGTFERKGTSDTAWSAWTKLEDTAGSQAKANQALSDAKAYITTEVTKTNNKVASIETNLNGITSRVSNVETKTTTLDGKVTSQEARIKTAESKITDSAIINTVSSTIDTKVNNGVNGIVLGGENLLRCSDFIKNDSTLGWTSYSVSIGGQYNGVNYVRYNNSTNTSNYVDALQQQIYTPSTGAKLLEPSTWYTLSFYASGSGSVRTHIYPSIVDDSVKGIVDGVSTALASDGHRNWSLTTTWTRHTYTFKTKSSIGNTTQNLLFRMLQSSDIRICMPKLEKGNKASDWSISTRDVQSNISKVEQTANNITSTVSDLSGKYTEIKQTIDGIDLTGKVSFSDLSTSGKTTIHGANLSTGTVTADKIAAGAITANMITTGTLNASKVNVTNLNASNITSGTISGDRIKGGTLSATNEINFVGGARIFGNAGSYGAGLKISAQEYQFKSGDAYFESNVYVKGNLAYHAGNKPTPSAIGALSTSGGTVSGNLTVNGTLYGTNSIALSRGSVYIANFGANYTMNHLRGNSNNIISFTDGGGIHFLYSSYSGASMARGSIYLPYNGNTTCDHFRLGYGVMASPSSGSFHFLTANGSASPLYSGTVYTKSILTANETKTITEKSVFDEINNINVISTKDGLRLFNPVETTDELDSSPCVVKTQYNKEKEHIETDMDYTSAIATLWKAVQELKEENQELKNKIKELMPSA